MKEFVVPAYSLLGALKFVAVKPDDPTRIVALVREVVTETRHHDAPSVFERVIVLFRSDTREGWIGRDVTPVHDVHRVGVKHEAPRLVVPNWFQLGTEIIVARNN